VAPDVLIVGAGIVGCAAGEALVRQGASVSFVDPEGVGLGATQASAGMLTPYSEGLHDPVLEALGLRSLWLWDAFVERLFDGERAALEAIARGELGATVESNPRFGPLAFDTIEKVRHGEPLPRSILITDRFFDRANAAQFVAEAY